MAKIHHSSIIDIRAELDEDVEVGPFCMVGPHVRIGAGTVLESHVVVKGLTTIGRNNRFFQGAAVGCEPQDKKYKGEETYLEIGDDNMSFAKTARFRPARFRIRASRASAAAIC